MVKVKLKLNTKTENDYFNCYSYLERFWPRVARSSKVWPENRWLLRQYLAVVNKLALEHNKKFANLDISTGPTLAPTLVFSPLLEELQLSDYSETCRQILTSMNVGYWSEYASEILKMEGPMVNKDTIANRLSKLDSLRGKHPIVKSDLKSQNIFTPEVACSKFNLFTMHFVADSITSSKPEYFKILGKVLNLLKSEDVLVFSALIDCTVWDDGIDDYPSPRVSAREIEAFLVRRKLRKIYANKSNFKSNEGHDGNFAIFCYAKT